MRSPQVISHWYKSYEDFQTSSQDFYATVEEAVRRREMPGLLMQRVIWHEGGMISANREYLRISRGRINFDLCAAPFGTGFFFSSWVAPARSSKALLNLLIMLTIPAFLSYVLLMRLGGCAGSFMALFLIPGTMLLIGYLVHSGLFGSEEAVMRIPFLGPLYELIFQAETYFKIDTDTVFWEFVHAAVVESVEAVTAVKGIRGLTDEERQLLPGSRQRAIGDGGTPKVA